MDISRLPSPNCDYREIPVEYLVLHYTAVSLEEAIAIFTEPDNVSAHLVIDTDGSVYEMVDCLKGSAHRAWHAGVSRWQDKEVFNDFSIGIELVNLNGNLFPYSEAQYDALLEVVRQLQVHYPNLRKADRVVGHEHIAGFRGKADPGRFFDWTCFFDSAYPKQEHPVREPVCTVEQQKVLMEKALKEAPEGQDIAPDFWRKLSETTENLIGQRSKDSE